MIPKQFVCQALLKIILTNKLAETCKSSICFRVILLNFSYSLQLFMPIICLLICSFRNITYNVTFWPLKETGYDQNFIWNIQNLQQHVPIFGACIYILITFLNSSSILTHGIVYPPGRTYIYTSGVLSLC